MSLTYTTILQMSSRRAPASSSSVFTFDIACSVWAATSPTTDTLGGVEIPSGLAMQEHEVVRHHGLAEVVVEPLLGVGVLGVEFADSRVGHQRLLMLLGVVDAAAVGMPDGAAD